MGTRNLTIVIDEQGDKKISQYGQFDGYPEGQGYNILEIMENEKIVSKLKSNLSKCRFIEAEGRDKELIESYNKNAPTWSNEPDNRTEEQKKWFNTYFNRGIGSDILKSVANSDLEEILLDLDEKAEDDIWIEYWYEINFQTNTLKVNDIIEFDLDNLPEKEKFAKSIYEALGYEYEEA